MKQYKFLKDPPARRVDPFDHSNIWPVARCSVKQRRLYHISPARNYFNFSALLPLAGPRNILGARMAKPFPIYFDVLQLFDGISPRLRLVESILIFLLSDRSSRFSSSPRRGYRVLV